MNVKQQAPSYIQIIDHFELHQCDPLQQIEHFLFHLEQQRS